MVQHKVGILMELKKDIGQVVRGMAYKIVDLVAIQIAQQMKHLH